MLLLCACGVSISCLIAEGDSNGHFDFDFVGFRTAISISISYIVNCDAVVRTGGDSFQTSIALISSVSYFHPFVRSCCIWFCCTRRDNPESPIAGVFVDKREYEMKRVIGKVGAIAWRVGLCEWKGAVEEGGKDVWMQDDAVDPAPAQRRRGHRRLAHPPCHSGGGPDQPRAEGSLLPLLHLTGEEGLCFERVRDRGSPGFKTPRMPKSISTLTNRLARRPSIRHAFKE